ncbi:MAG: helix-turn-helix domain-containing protein [Ruminococcus sp.]|nr:helix-turn-helix domain-containing protein [Ruminococcus sp.]MCM1382142.1 helix-turn-helix domain-containing protein [Muribaculaceae bacterium]MCM1480825.1 helix-turn-helix domain-containing protein [Muribaculaceae bacterium]
MNIGKSVAKYREAKGFNQQELADRVHVTQATIARLEKDTKIPSFEIMAQIAEVLECSLDDLHGD